MDSVDKGQSLRAKISLFSAWFFGKTLKQSHISTDNRTDKQKVGDFGEDLAALFLSNKRFQILDRKYLKKWGEIDIVAKNKGILHFVEVKTVISKFLASGTLGADGNDNYEAEEQVHEWKRQRLSRVIQTYLLEKKVPDEQEYQVDVIAIYINPQTKKARIRWIQDIGL